MNNSNLLFSTVNLRQNNIAVVFTIIFFWQKADGKRQTFVRGTCKRFQFVRYFVRRLLSFGLLSSWVIGFWVIGFVGYWVLGYCSGVLAVSRGSFCRLPFAVCRLPFR
jgi:hypothetical protein